MIILFSEGSALIFWISINPDMRIIYSFT